MPSPTNGVKLVDVDQPTLARIAETHKAVADRLSMETGMNVALLSYALLRAMQMASVAGVSHSVGSAQSVIDITTRIAARMTSDRSTSPPN